LPTRAPHDIANSREEVLTLKRADVEDGWAASAGIVGKGDNLEHAVRRALVTVEERLQTEMSAASAAAE